MLDIIINNLRTTVENKRVVVGMSGGVDSSVAAYLLKQAGADVHGVFMKNWEEEFDSGYCTVQEDLSDAEKVCATINIPLHKVNFAKEYKTHVFNYFLDTLKMGLTPNPDVLCNKEIKFKCFLEYAQALGADHIATGHYARLNHALGSSKLLKGLDSTKDQSYFLHLLNQNQLNTALFPLGDLPKKQVRQIAEEQSLITFDKKDSTGICFIGERDFAEFIQQYLPTKAGKMITPEGKTIGEHQGLSFYTIGQRQGLGIGGQKNSNGEAWFVADKNLASNELIVVQGEHSALYGQGLLAHQVHWISGQAPDKELLHAKIRYRQNDQACKIILLDEQNVQVDFLEPQRAITPGQSIVFYDGEECLGGAIIKNKI